MRLDLCVKYRASLIACAAIHLASKALHFHLPLQHSSEIHGGKEKTDDKRIVASSSFSSGCDWWRMFDDSFNTIQIIADAITALYDISRPSWICPLASAGYQECARELSIHGIPVNTSHRNSSGIDTYVSDKVEILEHDAEYDIHNSNSSGSGTYSGNGSGHPLQQGAQPSHVDTSLSASPGPGPGPGPGSRRRERDEDRRHASTGSKGSTASKASRFTNRSRSRSRSNRHEKGSARSGRYRSRSRSRDRGRRGHMDRNRVR
jgi:hypothetical protein